MLPIEVNFFNIEEIYLTLEVIFLQSDLFKQQFILLKYKNNHQKYSFILLKYNFELNKYNFIPMNYILELKKNV